LVIVWWPRTEGCHGGSTSGTAGGTPGAVAEISDVGVAEIAPGIAGKILYVDGKGPDMAGKVSSTVGNVLGVADRKGDTMLPGAAGEASREIASDMVVVPLCDDCCKSKVEA